MFEYRHLEARLRIEERLREAERRRLAARISRPELRMAPRASRTLALRLSRVG